MHSEEFTNKDFNEVARFTHLCTSYSWLSKAVANNNVEIIGRKSNKTIMYKSLICEVEQ